MDDNVCFAWVGECSVLTCKSCPPTCSFHKTRCAHEVGMILAYKRIRRLPEKTQQKIAQKYYYGVMPWSRQK